MVHPARTALAALLLAALAIPAGAGVPSPANSTVPTCFAACPLGDLHIVVVVRDFADNPVAGSTVTLDLSGCPGAFVCTTPWPDPYVYDAPSRTVRMVSDGGGRAEFPLRVGGGCGAGGVRLYADGVWLASYALASPDQDGDGLTANLLTADAAIFAAKFGTSDPTADFDCDGDVDHDDRIVLDLHASKSCDGFVDPAMRSTWGRVKSFYR